MGGTRVSAAAECGQERSECDRVGEQVPGGDDLVEDCERPLFREIAVGSAKKYSYFSLSCHYNQIKTK